MLSRSNLHPYQQKAVQFILERPSCALWLDLGLGKTISTLTALADLVDGMEIERALIVAPLRVANSVWKQEAEKWAHTRHLRISVCTGPQKDRLKALSRNADIYVINRENIPWLAKHYGKKWPFDCVVLDEASSFKSSKAQRWRSLKRARPAINRMIELTGTPSPNGLLDLWAQVYLLDQGQRLGRTKTSYQRKWFDSDFMGYNWTPRTGADEQIHAAVSDLVLSMTAEDYLDMPDRFDIAVPVPLPASARRYYDDLARTLLAELEDGAEIEAVNAAALANKLLQVANGAAYTDDEGNWSELHSAKLDALQEIVEDNPDEPLLVAYNYKTDLVRLRERFPDAVVLGKDQKTIDDWNAGKIGMLLAHPASAGHGLNLQRGGSVLVWFGLNWSLELTQQFNGRLHRQGQKKPVRVISLVAEGTIDERVVDVLKNKDATQKNLIDALKAEKPDNKKRGLSP